jgi:hypothetical protein
MILAELPIEIVQKFLSENLHPGERVVRARITIQVEDAVHSWDFKPEEVAK